MAEACSMAGIYTVWYLADLVFEEEGRAGALPLVLFLRFGVEDVHSGFSVSGLHCFGYLDN